MQKPSQAIIAHKQTGQILSVPIPRAEAMAAGGDWFIACRETDDLQDAALLRAPSPVKASPAKPTSDRVPLPSALSPIARYVVEVKYLHIKPHHSDSPERKALKLEESRVAREHENICDWTYHKPIASWTAEDIQEVIDRVRKDMPSHVPTTHSMKRSLQFAGDNYPDGRALCRLSFLVFAFMGGRRLEPCRIWFSTNAGYTAAIDLPAPPPARTVAQFLGAFDDNTSISIEPNWKAQRRVACDFIIPDQDEEAA